MVAREALRGRNYLALWRMRQVYPDFRENAGRYFLGRGDYPYDCRGAHAAGRRRADASTADTTCGRSTRCSAGATTGTIARPARSWTWARTSGSALCSSSPATRPAAVWLYEPVPRNVERLRAQPGGLRGSLRADGGGGQRRGRARRVRRGGQRPLRGHRGGHRRDASRSPASASTRCSTACSSRCPSSTCSRSTPREASSRRSRRSARSCWPRCARSTSRSRSAPCTPPTPSTT